MLAPCNSEFDYIACVEHIPANFLPEVGFFSLTIKMKLAGKYARNMLRIPGETAFTGK